ncbi:MAG: hypothetical protein M3323_11135 [Actinomycetota bacterium]|nr:hypothetical protein [Actinomycetota bacterium]
MRATEPGLLERVPGLPNPPEDGVHRHDGGFSLVTDPGGGRVKKLPSLYVNTTQLYADRDVHAVRAQLDRAVDAFMSSAERPTYMLTACEIGGRKGLYGTDFFNRSVYRRKLERLGMRFSGEQFTVFDGEATFHAEGIGSFRPSFVTLPRRSDNPSEVWEIRGALLVHQLTFYRIADIAPTELSSLVSLAGGLDALGATEPEDLAAALGGG